MKALTFIILIIIIRCITMIFIKDKEKSESLFLKISFFCLFLIVAISEPYSDMHNYLKYFSYFNEMPMDSFFRFDLEPLFKILTLIIGKIWFNERFYICVIALITTIGPYYCIKRYSKNYFLATILYISIGGFTNQFYILRQMVATSIILLGLKYVENKDFKKFVLTIIIATLFHYSAIVFVVIYFFDKLKNYQKIILSLLIVVPLFLFKDSLYSLIGFSRYSKYFGTEYDVVGHGYWQLLTYVIMLLFCLIFRNKKEKNVGDNIMLTMMVFCTLFQILATQIIIANRITRYFSIAFAILPGNVIKKSKFGDNVILLKIIVVLLAIAYVLVINTMEWYSVIE